MRHRTAFLDHFLKEKIMEKILSEEHYPLIHSKIESFLKKLRRNTPKRVGNLNRDLAGVRSKIDNLIEAIGEGVVDHAMAREKLEAYKKQKADLEGQISQASIPYPVDISIPWNIFGTIMELIRSALEKEKTP